MPICLCDTSKRQGQSPKKQGLEISWMVNQKFEKREKWMKTPTEHVTPRKWSGGYCNSVWPRKMPHNLASLNIIALAWLRLRSTSEKWGMLRTREIVASWEEHTKWLSNTKSALKMHRNVHTSNILWVEQVGSIIHPSIFVSIHPSVYLSIWAGSTYTHIHIQKNPQFLKRCQEFERQQSREGLEGEKVMEEWCNYINLKINIEKRRLYKPSS